MDVIFNLQAEEQDAYVRSARTTTVSRQILSDSWYFYAKRLTHKSQVSFFVVLGNSGGQNQMPQNAASDQGLQCLLTECSIERINNEKTTTEQPFKLKRTGPINKNGKFHFS